MFPLLKYALSSVIPSSATKLVTTCVPSGLLSALPTGATALNVLTQRFKYRARKPPGGPRSRKKRYWTLPLKPIDPEELSELFWRWNHYRTMRRSMKKYFIAWKEEHYPDEAKLKAEKAAMAVMPSSGVLPEEFRLAIEQNDVDNQKVFKIREARRQEKLKWSEDARLDAYEEFQFQANQERAIREEQITRKKRIASGLVTKETLQERLNWAFEHPVDYNYAIDLGGRKTYGRPDPLRKVNMFQYPSRLQPGGVGPPGPADQASARKAVAENEGELDRMLDDVDRQQDQREVRR